jgi:iron-sulfur cluster repair protein YtfE (RIC family)
MTQSLPQVAHEHHERLLHHVDQMPALADALLTARAQEVRAGLAEMSAFLSGTLIPHVDAAERTMYPELERMFQNRHSMAPMRREHEEIRKLVTRARSRSVGRSASAGSCSSCTRCSRSTWPRRTPTCESWSAAWTRTSPT